MRQRLLVPVGLLYVIFCWALNTVLVKIVVADFDPLAFTFMRFVFMTPLAYVLARATGNRIAIARKDIVPLILCGACGYGLYQYFWILGLSHTTAFASALFSGFAPIFTLLVVVALRYERVRSGRWAGAVIAMIGIAIYEGIFAGHAGFQLGDMLTLCGAALFAGYNVVSARLLDRYTPLSLLFITMLIGTLIIAPGGLWALAHAHFNRFNAFDGGVLIYATLFPILLTYPVWSWGITRIGAARVSLYSFLTPIIAGLLSLPILHARFAPYQLAGAAICIGGMALSQLIGRVSLTALWAARTQGMER